MRISIKKWHMLSLLLVFYFNHGGYSYCGERMIPVYRKAAVQEEKYYLDTNSRQPQPSNELYIIMYS